MVTRPIGVLALQGAYARHQAVLDRLGQASRRVRTPSDLEGLQGLIIPGGESTTLSRLLDANGLWQPLREFARHHGVMGTCAGLIMMAETVDDSRVTPLGLLPLAVVRNHYGRQVHSFRTRVDLALPEPRPFEAVFIRAPRISRHAPELEVLGRLGEDPILVRTGNHLGLSFHPELTTDPAVHRFWIDHCLAPARACA